MTTSTIDERRRREAYDKAHPWQPMTIDPPEGGALVELLFADMAGGTFTVGEEARFFLDWDEDGRPAWYRVDVPGKARKRPVNWRPTASKVPVQRRAEIIRKAKGADW